MKKKLLLLLVCILTGALSAMALEAYVEKTNNTTLTFRYGTRPQTGTTYSLNTGSNEPGWHSDGTYQNVTKVVFDSSFDQVRPTRTSRWFQDMSNLTSITGWQYLHTDNVGDMTEMFDGCYRLTELDLSRFNTSNVTYMSYMFHNCSSLTTLDLSSFNTSNVTNMNHMFLDCTNLKYLDLSSFNTSNVTNMIKMFKYCTNLTTIYVSSGWSTANVNGSSEMFYECTSLVGGNGTRYDEDYIDKTYARIDAPGSRGYLTDRNAPKPYVVYNSANTTLTFAYGTPPLEAYNLNQPGGYSPDWFEDGTYQNVTKVVFDSSFDEARPTTTLMWFYGMTNLTEITGWQYLHTDEVYQTNEMFWGCSSLTELDLSHFNTSNLRYMERMFANCTNLTTIYVGTGWTTAQASTYKLMFINCTKLVGGQGTTYDPDHVDVAYAHIDGGPSNPGYFTDINAPKPYVQYHDLLHTLLFYYASSPTQGQHIRNYTLNTGSNAPGWYTDGTYQDVTRVIFDSSFDEARPTSNLYWFRGMTNLTQITGLEYLHTDAVTNMGGMFFDCSGLSSLDLSSFNTSNVTNMQSMFLKCSGLTELDLTNFNTSKVTNMNAMFSECTNLATIYASNQWSTSNVTNSAYMFDECTNLVGGQGTTYDANHIDKAYAHIDGGPNNPGYFTDKNAQPEPYAVYNSNTTTLTFSYGMRPAGAYTLNTEFESPGWVTDHAYENVTKVVFDPSFANAYPTSAYCWFYNMSNLTEITGLEYLNTDSVTIMRHMFQGCAKLTTLDLTHFNTGKLVNTYSMFNMYGTDSQLKTIYVGSGWTTANVTTSSYMFMGCTNLVGSQGTTYDENHIDKAYAHIDGGTSDPGYFSEKVQAYVQYHQILHTLSFYCASTPAHGNNIRNYTLESLGWFYDDTYQDVTRVVFDSSFDQARPTSTAMWFYGMANLTTITGWQNLHTDSVTNMAGMFYGCSSLSSLNVSNFNTSNVTDMQYMFGGCSGLSNLDVSSFDTQNVTDMSGMFAGCGVTSLDLSDFDTRNVTDMTYMFYGCGNLTDVDVTSFNTSNVTSMQGTFAYCSSLQSLFLNFYFNTSKVNDMQNMFAHCTSLTELDLQYFNTSKVVSFASMLDSCANLTELNLGRQFKADNAVEFYRMFADCSSLTSLNLGYFNPVKAKSMGSMFQGCSSLTKIDMGNFGNTEDLDRIDHMFQGCSSLKTLDLSGIYTGNVTSMYCTFYGCNSLETIYVGSQWSTANVTNSALMFNGCTSLVGGQGTTFDPNYTNDAYAHIDGGTSNPGYMTGETPYAVYNPNTTTLTFSYGLRPVGAYGLNTERTLPRWFTNGSMQQVTKVVFDPSFDSARPTSNCGWFYGMTNLTSITGLEYLHTDESTYMYSMFNDCVSLESLDLSHFNTSKVTNMYGMFWSVPLTTLDLSTFNTSNVTNMASMFEDCENLETIYVSNGWNTSNVGNSLFMFSNCLNLVGGMGTTYDASHVDAAYAHIDGGTSNPGYLTEKPAGKPGDANGDGKVDVNDVTTVINYILGKNPSPFIFENADVNGDGEVNVMDVTLIINIILGIN